MAKASCPLLCALAIGLSAGSGRADSPPAPRVMRLEYVLGPEAKSCPVAKVFRDAVIMGHRADPFDDSAAAQMRVTISSLHSLYYASIEVRDGAGGVIWTKEMPARVRCETLVRKAGIEVHNWLAETFPSEAALPPLLPPPLPRFVKLEYSYPSNSHCPSEETFQDFISDIMPYDPFVQVAGDRMIVSIRRDKRTYRGHVEIQDVTNRVLWSFDLDGVGCLQVASGLSLTIGILLDPLPSPKPAKPPSPPAAPPKPAEPPSPPAAPPKPPLPRQPERPGFALGLGGAFSVRTAAPLLAGELVADAGIRFPVFAVSGEFRWTLPASVESGQASTTQLTGGVIPCGHFPALFLCGVAQVTAVVRMPSQGSQGLMLPSDAGLTAATGARIGKDWPVSGRFAVRVSADLLVTLHQVAIHYDESPVGWTTAGFMFGLGAGFVTDL